MERRDTSARTEPNPVMDLRKGILVTRESVVVFGTQTSGLKRLETPTVHNSQANDLR